MTTRTRLITAAAVLSMTLAACGGGTTVGQAANPAPEVAPLEQSTSIDVLAADSPLGNILVGPNGLSLYGFTNDVDAASTCYGTCAEAWPPVLVSDDWTASPGLDYGIFATTVRDDGQTQLVAGRWPLYYFAGDATPGDLNGQGSGDVWFLVDATGRLIEGDAGAEPAASAGNDEGTEPAAGDDAVTDDQPAELVSVADTRLGSALIDADGLTLYGFLNDVDGQPSCNDACADAWPPLLTDGPAVPAELDPTIFSVAGRDDGEFQLVAGVWPLYRFAGDGAPGDVNGQGSGDVWFVADPDGGLIGAGTAMQDAGSVATEGETSTSDGY